MERSKKTMVHWRDGKWPPEETETPPQAEVPGKRQ
jgi:hypothetical protein